MRKDVSKTRVLRVKDDVKEWLEVEVPQESSITIYLNEKELLTVQATPAFVPSLAVGLLHFEGILKSKDDLESVAYDEKQGIVWVETRRKDTLAEKLMFKRYYTSGCGQGVSLSSPSDLKGIDPVESELQVSVAEVFELQRKLHQKARLYREAGGVHSSALCSKEDIIVCMEDIGRHNTLDKIMGECLTNEIATEDKILITTGRISSEMLLKGAKMKVPILVSRTAPTNTAILMGQKLGLTVVGYAKAGRINVYCHEERISDGYI